jgi:hypothetical protein
MVMKRRQTRDYGRISQLWKFPTAPRWAGLPLNDEFGWRSTCRVKFEENMAWELLSERETKQTESQTLVKDKGRS